MKYNNLDDEDNTIIQPKNTLKKVVNKVVDKYIDDTINYEHVEAAWLTLNKPKDMQEFYTQAALDNYRKVDFS